MKKKNTIILLVDGFGFTHLGLLEKLRPGVTDFFDVLVRVNTDDQNGQTADSASGISQYSTALPSKVNEINMNSRKPLLVLAKSKGYSTAMCVCCYVTDATPAGMICSNIKSRMFFNKIAEQMSKKLPDYICAAATRRTQQIFAKNGAHRNVHFYSEEERFANEGRELSLTQQVKMALDHVDSEKPYFLFCESSMVDRACHASDVDALIAELQQTADLIDFIKSNVCFDNTQFLIISDHSTGNLRYDTHEGVSTDYAYHTSAEVPLLAVGLDPAIKSKLQKQILFKQSDVGTIIRKAL